MPVVAFFALLAPILATIASLIHNNVALRASLKAVAVTASSGPDIIHEILFIVSQARSVRLPSLNIDKWTLFPAAEHFFEEDCFAVENPIVLGPPNAIIVYVDHPAGDTDHKQPRHYAVA